MIKPAGDVYDTEGNKTGFNEGNTTWDYLALVLFSLVTYITFGMVRNSLDNGL